MRKLFVVKKIYSERQTDDKRSKYFPIIFYIIGEEENELVLHLRSDKNINKLNFEVGDIWENLELSNKSKRDNVLELSKISFTQHLGNINEFISISKTKFDITEVEIFKSISNYRERLIVVKLNDIHYSVTYSTPNIIETLVLTREEILYQYHTLIQK